MAKEFTVAVFCFIADKLSFTNFSKVSTDELPPTPSFISPFFFALTFSLFTVAKVAGVVTTSTASFCILELCVAEEDSFGDFTFVSLTFVCTKTSIFLLLLASVFVVSEDFEPSSIDFLFNFSLRGT